MLEMTAKDKKECSAKYSQSRSVIVSVLCPSLRLWYTIIITYLARSQAGWLGMYYFSIFYLTYKENKEFQTKSLMKVLTMNTTWKACVWYEPFSLVMQLIVPDYTCNWRRRLCVTLPHQIRPPFEKAEWFCARKS